MMSLICGDSPRERDGHVNGNVDVNVPTMAAPENVQVSVH